MFTRILVPLDGSVCSERAPPYAASLAKAFGGELILLHDETVGLRGDNAPAAADAISRITGLSRAPEGMGLRVRMRVVHGAAASAILGAADDENVDLIVMATHGQTGLGWLTRGSVATRVLQSANTPFLLFRLESLSATSVEASGSVAAG